jgi:hypothetical protein
MDLLFQNDFVITGFYEINTKHKNGKIVKELDLLNHLKEIPNFLIIEATSKK